jgi:glucosamine-6-phosphate deaminase
MEERELPKSFRADALDVRVYPRLQEMAAAAAAAARDFLALSVARQGQARVILATGNSQLTFLECLIALSGVNWSKVTLFHMDEYLGIDADHSASFRRFMRDRVEHRLKPRKFHYLEGDTLEPLKECDRYSRLLRSLPVDLCCLGIGENGHLAFNDPPVADFDDPLTVKLVKLDEACRQQQVGEGHFPSIAAVPQYAFTLTVPALCAAKKMICTVPEKRKAQAVTNALRGPITTACPASFLRRQGHCMLFLEAESASLI